MEPKEQSVADRAEIKVKLIDNGILVKQGPSWRTFNNWFDASIHIGARIEKLKKEWSEKPR